MKWKSIGNESRPSFVIEGNYARCGFYLSQGVWMGYCGSRFFGLDGGMTIEEKKRYVLSMAIKYATSELDELREAM